MPVILKEPALPNRLAFLACAESRSSVILRSRLILESTLLMDGLRCCEAHESIVRTVLIVVMPPDLGDFLRESQQFEPVHVQGLVAQRTVERLDLTVVA